jgi:hypothetical protein
MTHTFRELDKHLVRIGWSPKKDDNSDQAYEKLWVTVLKSAAKLDMVHQIEDGDGVIWPSGGLALVII